MVSHIRLEEMVDRIEEIFPLRPFEREAFLRVDRDFFVPSGFGHLSYKLDALPMIAEQWISSPLTVAKMTHYLDLEGADSVLEIGCGSGYQAAILAQIVRRVFTIERIEPILREARERFRSLGITNISTRYDDGQRGWREFAPYDRILLSATADTIPPRLFEQLDYDGILLAPINNGDEHIITKFTKTHRGIISESLEACLFVPIVDGTKR